MTGSTGTTAGSCGKNGVGSSAGKSANSSDTKTGEPSGETADGSSQERIGEPCSATTAAGSGEGTVACAEATTSVFAGEAADGCPAFPSDVSESKPVRSSPEVSMISTTIAGARRAATFRLGGAVTVGTTTDVSPGRGSSEEEGMGLSIERVFDSQRRNPLRGKPRLGQRAENGRAQQHARRHVPLGAGDREHAVGALPHG